VLLHSPGDGQSEARLRLPFRTLSVAPSLGQTTLHRGSDEYPRGLTNSVARNAHCFFPHFEHLIRFATSSSFVSHPQNFANICGGAVRLCPQAPHVISSEY
jgi:hypothetical protein